MEETWVQSIKRNVGEPNFNRIHSLLTSIKVLEIFWLLKGFWKIALDIWFWTRIWEQQRAPLWLVYHYQSFKDMYLHVHVYGGFIPVSPALPRDIYFLSFEKKYITIKFGKGCWISFTVARKFKVRVHVYLFHFGKLFSQWISTRMRGRPRMMVNPSLPIHWTTWTVCINFFKRERINYCIIINFPEG